MSILEWPRNLLRSRHPLLPTWGSTNMGNEWNCFNMFQCLFLAQNSTLIKYALIFISVMHFVNELCGTISHYKLHQLYIIQYINSWFSFFNYVNQIHYEGEEIQNTNSYWHRRHLYVNDLKKLYVNFEVSLCFMGWQISKHLMIYTHL